jgi:hypothetical protein
MPIHVVVMTGIVRLIRALHAAMLENKEFTLDNALSISLENVTDDMARICIVEFIKDGLPGFSEKDIETIAITGDYTKLWRMTNRFLHQLGYAPIEPVPLAIS